jgi:hypothetical protein
MEIGFIFVALLCLALSTQRWFWLIVFGIGSIAACFAFLANIIHFKMFSSAAYIALMLLSWKIARVIADGYPPSNGNIPQDSKLPPKPDTPDWSPHQVDRQDR